MDNYFLALNSINVSDKIEKKGNLSYLSWAWAWAELKKVHPNATYTVYENQDGCFYHNDGKTCWVKTGVTVDGIEHIEYLPVMDFKNKSISYDKVTSTDVNKTIQRSLTKAVARHGLGLYIYAGEDLPDGEETIKQDTPKPQIKTEQPLICKVCNQEIKAQRKQNGTLVSANDVAKGCNGMCFNCWQENEKLKQ